MLPNNQESTNSKQIARMMSLFMSRVYFWMMGGILISGITAYVVAQRPDVVAYMMQQPFIFYGLIFLQLMAVLALSIWVNRMSVGVASTVYALYATLVGLTFSSIFLIYTLPSISTAFFSTAFAFAGLSFFGYVTQKDLGPIGSFCTMGLFGMLGMMLLSLFIPSMMNNSMQLTMAVIGILVFSGLTAYDTQKIKALQFQYASDEQSRKGAIHGALILYLDFINLFLSILRIVGDKK